VRRLRYVVAERARVTAAGCRYVFLTPALRATVRAYFSDVILPWSRRTYVFDGPGFADPLRTVMSAS
jgi:hypothetical protein